MKTLNNYIFLIISIAVFSCANQETTNHDADHSSKLHSLDEFVTFDNEDSIVADEKSLNGFIDFDAYKASFDTLINDNKVYYIVEGDLLLDIDELKIHFFKSNRPTENRKLVGIMRDGKILKIENPSNITYAIIKETFSEKEYKEIVAQMNEATLNWERVCKVDFTHKSELDNKLAATDNPEEVTFVVRKVGPVSNGLLASAFFPYDPKSERKVLITPSFFNTSFNKSGILTHEIGHILGFRHEHIRSGAPAACPKESTVSTIDLTQYDPQSVMHYFCGGAGSRELKITLTDSIGASLVYN